MYADFFTHPDSFIHTASLTSAEDRFVFVGFISDISPFYLLIFSIYSCSYYFMYLAEKLLTQAFFSGKSK